MNNVMAAGLAKATVAKNQAKNKLRRDWNDFKNGELSGQGLIEYVLIIAVVSLVVIFAGPAVAKAIKDQFDKVASVLSKGTGTGFGDGSLVG